MPNGTRVQIPDMARTEVMLLGFDFQMIFVRNVRWFRGKPPHLQ